MDAFFKFTIYIDNLLKLLILCLPCKYLNLSLGTLWFVHTVPQRVTQNLSACTVHDVNHLVSQFEALLCVRISNGDKFSSLAKFSAVMTSCFLNRLNWLKSFSHCEILYQSELFVVIFLENIDFYT